MKTSEQKALRELGLVLDLDDWDIELGKKLYAIGIRQLKNEQFSRVYYPLLETVEGTGFGSGVYELMESGDLGKCIFYRYDSSG